ncbi:unnamed protein product [Diatraea saccharalis]|uniref:C2H2-type domain-containing protein n=1 Tax=Diatraea saccharalis TaxID=40085 RepID=A0A9N9WIN3_9NEOP|nr:unnamed protein product [Diatraea saccharalis]
MLSSGHLTADYDDDYCFRYHPNREHECKVCQKKVMGWFGLQKHMAIHNKDCHQCDLCPKRFKHAHSLSKHRDTHLEKTHACAECPKKFGSQTLLKIHMRSHERALRGRTFRCTYCGKGFYEAYTLQVIARFHQSTYQYIPHTNSLTLQSLSLFPSQLSSIFKSQFYIFVPVAESLLKSIGYSK